VNPTIELEQWGTVGHPWHSNYKTKLGVDTGRVIAMSPEFESTIDVVWTAVRTDCLCIQSMANQEKDFRSWWMDTFASVAGRWHAALSGKGTPEWDEIGPFVI
jgi:hypothetical protein